MAPTLAAVIQTINLEADNVVSLVLRPATGTVFPPFDAGAHVDVHLPNELVRSYSLVNSTEEVDRYVIAVLQEQRSRGGSSCVHRDLRVGMKLKITAPLNNFPLREDAAHSVLIAGGIGITPILCMARRLKTLGRSFEMMYFARSRTAAAFASDVAALGVPVTWHFDVEHGGAPDLLGLLRSRSQAAGADYYACGPTPLLDAFERQCKELGYARANVERFSGEPLEASDDARAAFTVELKRSGRVFNIASNKSILATLLEAGIDVGYNCQEGICGSCETRVLAGQPDHRDRVLSEAERAAGESMMICVSGCKSEKLVLDL